MGKYVSECGLNAYKDTLLVNTNNPKNIAIVNSMLAETYPMHGLKIIEGELGYHIDMSKLSKLARKGVENRVSHLLQELEARPKNGNADDGIAVEKCLAQLPPDKANAIRKYLEIYKQQ